MKTCTKCNKKRQDKSFSKLWSSPDGLTKVCRKCRSDARRVEYSENPEHYIEKSHNWKKNNPERWMLKHVRKSAKERNLEFDLDQSDIVIPKVCPIFGIPLVFGSKSRTANSPSVDRIDSSRGYVKGNIQIISWRANDLKGNATPDELRKLADYMEVCK